MIDREVTYDDGIVRATVSPQEFPESVRFTRKGEEGEESQSIIVSREMLENVLSEMDATEEEYHG